MKVLILSTFGNYGGAATCSRRLFHALKNQGLDVKLRVLQFYDLESAKPLFGDSIISWIRIKWHFIRERLEVLFSVDERKYLYKFSTGSSGFNLLDHPLVKEADIIHLHWINFGFISIEEIAKLARMKKVIWTLHDMWSFTGGCHYALHCDRYQRVCDDCFYLKRNSLSKEIQANKLRLWNTNRIKVLATSNWLAQCARNSAVFNKWDVEVLATPLDTAVFIPIAKDNLRSKHHIKDYEYCVLFGAVDLSDERKGFKYLLEAIKSLNTHIPNLRLVTFGDFEEEIPNIKCTSLGRINTQEELNEIYNLADVFVLPSIQDNLPNTVMEAMSSGLPVVAFDSGGVVDMIDHRKSGYLAENKQESALAEGLLYFQDKKLSVEAGMEARKAIEARFSNEVIVPKYFKLYENINKRKTL